MAEQVGNREFRKNKWFYTTSGIGRDMAYTLFANYLLSYVLFTRSVTPAQFAVLGVVLTVCRIWDGINDPLMGGIIENTRSRYGKFKPWIFIGALLNAAVLILMFVNRTQGWSFVVLFSVLYLLWDVTFTMNDIAYWSMLPSLTSDPKRRDSLASMANLFAAIGAILATGLIPTLTNGSAAIGGNSITAYAAVGIFIALFFLSCQTMACVFVKDYHIADSLKAEPVSFKKMLRVIVKNDQLVWVALIMILYNLGSALLTAFGVNYMYLSFGYNGMNVTLFVAAYAFASVAVNAAYPRIARHISRNKMAFWALLTTIAGYLLFLCTGFFIPLNIYILCVWAFIIGFGQTLFYMVTTVCLTNTIEYNEYKTGRRDEAIIFSLRPFMAKMSSALQQVILTLVYIIIGMTEVTNGISEIENKVNLKQMDESLKEGAIAGVLSSASPSMAVALRVCMVVLPVLLITAAYIVMRRKVKIDEKEYDRMLAEISKRRNT